MTQNDFIYRCEDCPNHIVKNNIHYCEECFNQLCTEIDDCPLGITVEEVKTLQEKGESVKIKHEARKAEKIASKPRTVKIADDKIVLFDYLKSCLDKFCEENQAEYTVEKDNKLIKMVYNGKKFTLDLVHNNKKQNKSC